MQSGKRSKFIGRKWLEATAPTPLKTKTDSPKKKVTACDINS